MIRHLLATHWQTNYHNATYQGNPRHQEKINGAQISESFARNYGQLPSCKADKQLPCTTGAISWSLEYACWCMSGRIGGATCCQSNPPVVLCGITWYWMVFHSVVWYCMVYHFIVWYCMVLYGTVWSELANTTFFTSASLNLLLHGIAFYHMILHRIIWYCMLL